MSKTAVIKMKRVIELKPMTGQEAKELCIKVWQYLADHPECRAKEETPYWEELAGLAFNCPLCHYIKECDNCPISVNKQCHVYWSWLNGDNSAAAEIVSLVSDWEPGEEK